MSVFSFLRIEFSILGIVALTMIFPIFAAIAFDESGTVSSFAIPMAIFLILAVTFLLAGRKKKIALSTRSAFVVVAFAWIFCSLRGAIPF